MPEITETKLKEQIAKEQIGSLYFLYGDEKLLVRRNLNRLLKKLDGNFPEFNFQEFPHDAPVDNIADAVVAMPFMAERKCVTVSDLNVEAMNTAELDKLYELLDTIPETTVLILYLPTLEIDPKKSAKWRTFLKKLDTRGFSLPSLRLKDNELEKYVCREAEKANCLLSRKLAERIVQYVGNDLNALTNEVTKLCAFAGGGEITAEQAKMGYVGAFTYAEVISGYTSFYLGAKSVCPSVTMDVTFTGSWYDEALEKEAANKLIAGGCKLISQHADSMGAPTACETAGVPNVSYNGSTQSACPNTFIVSSRIDWTPYYEMVIKAVQDGTALDSDWTGTLKTGSVVLTDVNEKVAAKGTAEKIAEVTKQLEDGTLHVFDTSTFTVNKAPLTSYMADVDTDADNTGDTEAIKDGYFHESEFRAAPYFNVQIDGINLLDQNFGS